MQIRKQLVIAALTVASFVSAESLQAAAGYSMAEIVETARTHADGLKAQYRAGSLTEDNVVGAVSASVKNAVEFHLGDGVRTLRTRLNSLTPQERAALVGRIRARLGQAIANLNIVIEKAGLHDLHSEITFGLKYAHDDLKLVPKELDRAYQKVYAFAEANPEAVNRLGRAARQLLIRLRDGLVRLQQGDAPSVAQILSFARDYKLSAQRALDKVIIPTIREHRKQLVGIYNTLSTVDFSRIDVAKLRARLRQAAGKSKFAS